MADNYIQKLYLDRPAAYQTKVPGTLDASWPDWDEKIKVTVEHDDKGLPIFNLNRFILRILIKLSKENYLNQP